MLHDRAQVSRNLLRLALAEGIGIGEEQAAVLVVLLERRGQAFTSEQMCRLANPHRRVRLGALQERISAIREVMGRDAIAGFKSAAERCTRGAYAGVTYAISDDGARQCHEALLSVAAVLTRTLDDGSPLRTDAEKAS